MFFYVDESGHTGANLFDPAQPRLYYGVLHSEGDLDSVAKQRVRTLRDMFGVERLHATELGVVRLQDAIPELLEIHFECDLCFDLYWIEKSDHAIICFFDQVFDQGLNPAVPWMSYWTPLRYILLVKVACLFDEQIAKDAWEARIDTRGVASTVTFLSVCKRLQKRVHLLSDARSREIIGDVLGWARSNPEKISYNCSVKKEVYAITPNVIGFQFVMQGIARRLRKPEGASRIVIDKQSQFNQSQKTLADYYAMFRDARISPSVGIGMPEVDFSNIPCTPLEFCAGTESIGLELVDIYLWIFRRFFDGVGLSAHFEPLIQSQMDRGQFDLVSLSAIEARWMKWFEQQSQSEPSEEDIANAIEVLAEQERRRNKAMGREG